MDRRTARQAPGLPAVFDVNDVWLDLRARAVIEREAVKRRLLETGGSLFGWEADDGIVVVCASGPGPSARHRRRLFEPNRTTTAAAIRAVHNASDGRYSYLGSWHTHPQAAPIPSGIDAATAREMSEQADLELKRPLLLILGTRGLTARAQVSELQAWRWEPTLGNLLRCELRACRLDERYVPEERDLFTTS